MLVVKIKWGNMCKELIQSREGGIALILWWFNWVLYSNEVFLRLLPSIYLLMRVKHLQGRDMGGERKPWFILGKLGPWVLGLPGHHTGRFVLVVMVEGKPGQKGVQGKPVRSGQRGSTVTGANRNSGVAAPGAAGPAWCKNKPLSPFLWVTLDSTLLILFQLPWWIWKIKADI